MMSDTFDRLCAMKLSQHRQEWGRGTIVVEVVDPSRCLATHACLFGVDGRRVAFLNSFRTVATCEVIEGEHELTVRLGPDLSKPLPIRIEEGERIDLVCGKKKEWALLESRLMRRLYVTYYVGLGLAALAWLAHPLLIAALFEAMTWFPPPELFVHTVQGLFKTRLSVAATANAAWFFPAFVALMIGKRREIRRFRKEFGPRCFLEPRSAQAFKKKAQVDPWDLE
jgi:hypothetical protein